MRIGEKFWHCKKILQNNAEFFRYELPVAYETRFRYITIQPSTSSRDMAEYGEEIKKYQVAVAQPYEMWEKVFKIGDRAYIDIEPTEEDLADEYADNANYEVDSILKQNKVIRIIFKKRVG